MFLEVKKLGVGVIERGRLIKDVLGSQKA